MTYIVKIPPEQKPLGDFYVLDIFAVFCINYNWICLTIYRYRDNIHYNLCDIMSTREPESCLQISGERRMTITIAAIAAASSKATNRDIIST